MTDSNSCTPLTFSSILPALALYQCFNLAGDCFTIAKAAYNDGDYYHVIMWMQEALKRLEKEEEPTADREDVLEYLSYSLYKQGNLKHALQLIEELYKLNPKHPRAKGNIKWYEDLLAQEGVKKADMRR
ncbi:tetratricopeptide repeat protein [Ancylostoma duodenale]|uniref:Tetratricopeptide repeat protein n=1 Tax=Ancylostoma duodenale TaxID=51022 RepID=A0A0C2G8X9_9BILA|nr:tetratricopeptide repeat protein [Ancylostoma duodenale]